MWADIEKRTCNLIIRFQVPFGKSTENMMMQYAIHTVYKCVLLGDKILVGCNISCEIIHLQQTIPMNEMQQRK